MAETTVHSGDNGNEIYVSEANVQEITVQYRLGQKAGVYKQEE